MTTQQGGPVDALAGQVARLFFEGQLTKVEIATRLGISRFRVARLIDQALADGIVRIEFRDLPPDDRALASRIEAAFPVDLCVVASAPPADGTTAAARLAAKLIDELLGPGETIGIAWGSTLWRVVQELPRRDDPLSSVVQLAGSSGRHVPGRDPGELTWTLAEHLGGTHHRLYAPAFVDSPSLRAALARQREVAEVMARFDRIAVALVGIGALGAGTPAGHSSLVSSGSLAADELARLADLGAVGDLVVHVFDADGRFVAPDIAERALAITADQLRQVPRVVAVAAGEAKAGAIAGALRTGIVDVLVTDDAAARRIVGGR